MTTQIGEGGAGKRNNRLRCENLLRSQGCEVSCNTNSSLKYGARLINSVLGDNSTISCCEVLNSLIFPGHEQHHNNSFLCASTVLGMSNMAAGVTIGSNHNSREKDGEIIAGRGFWPGLCTSLKHNSRFASFTLLIKGSYPSELDIMLPFCSVSNDEHDNSLRIQPAYWFLFNMYALTRISLKCKTRDKRKDPDQLIEYDYLAPDTAEEMFRALELIEEWTGKAWAQSNSAESADAAFYRSAGKRLLMGEPETVSSLKVLGEKIESSKRPCTILKPYEAYHAYREMIRFYAVKNIISFLEGRRAGTLKTLFPGWNQNEPENG